MSKNPHPHVAWRNGRPRFSPSKTLRRLGYKGKDLRHEDGRWFTKGEAVDWSVQFQKELALMKARKRPSALARRVPATAVKRPATRMMTVGELFQEWQHPMRGSIKFRNPDEIVAAPAERPVAGRRRLGAGRERLVYSPKTRQDINQKLGLIEIDHPDIWASPVDALTHEIMYGVYEEMVMARGLWQARGAIAWLSSMFSWGRKRGKVTFALNGGQNPAKGLGMMAPPPRIRYATREEIHALVAAADRLGMPEIGDAIILGVWTGQRQADRLQLIDKGLLNGRRVFRQQKTGAIVHIRESPELEKRLKAAAERRVMAGIISPYVILDEERWEPFWDGDRYRKRFALVRKEAAKSCPTVLGMGREDGVPLRDQDLRDTAVTWLALAEATIPEICAITGHELASATQILKHYLARHPQMADSGMAKMIEWYEQHGETDACI